MALPFSAEKINGTSSSVACEPDTWLAGPSLTASTPILRTSTSNIGPGPPALPRSDVVICICAVPRKSLKSGSGSKINPSNATLTSSISPWNVTVSLLVALPLLTVTLPAGFKVTLPWTTFNVTSTSLPASNPVISRSLTEIAVLLALSKVSGVSSSVVRVTLARSIEIPSIELIGGSLIAWTTMLMISMSVSLTPGWGFCPTLPLSLETTSMVARPLKLRSGLKTSVFNSSLTFSNVPCK